MIIFKYFSKEMVISIVAVTVLLLVVFVSNQFIRYLGAAAAGELASSVVFQIVFLQVPYLFGLLLPLGLFLALLLVYGRLSADGELTVLFACGMSHARWFAMSFSFALVVAMVAGVFTLWVSPHIMAVRAKVLAEARSASILQLIMPGRFLAFDDGRQVFYVEKMARDRHKVRNVFLAKQTKEKSEIGFGGSGQSKVDKKSKPQSKTQHENANQNDKVIWDIMVAGSGYPDVDPQTGDQYLITTDGYRYIGVPGQKDYKILQYKKHGNRLDHKPLPMDKKKVQAVSTLKLWKHRHDLKAGAELEWRLSAPISAFVLTLLALPLCRVKPRQGRYARLLPGILIYVVYANMLFIARAWYEDDLFPRVLGLWWVQCVTVLLTIPFLWQQLGGWRYFREKISGRKASGGFKA